MNTKYKESMKPETIEKLLKFKKMLAEGGLTITELSKVMGVSKNWYAKTDLKYRNFQKGI